jgi:hypothetical protein
VSLLDHSRTADSPNISTLFWDLWNLPTDVPICLGKLNPMTFAITSSVLDRAFTSILTFNPDSVIRSILVQLSKIPPGEASARVSDQVQQMSAKLIEFARGQGFEVSWVSGSGLLEMLRVTILITSY